MRYIFILLVFCLTSCSGTVDGSRVVTIIAHRGASSDAPEHTIAAYEMAKKIGADYIELDLGMTKDGKLIAIHDNTLDRTTNGKGKVNSQTLSQIKQLDAGSWFNQQFPNKAKEKYNGLHIPTLEEVIHKFGTTINYYIEVKKPNEYPEMTKELLKVLKSHHLVGNKAASGKVIIESFDSDSLKYIHKKYPNLFLIQLGDSHKMNLTEIATYADGVGPNFFTMDKGFVEKAHKKGLIVHCWTVDKEDEMKRLIDWGVDGIFTNDVRLAKKLTN